MVFISQTPRSVFDETKYLEIVIVIDHSMVCKKSVFDLMVPSKRTEAASDRFCMLLFFTLAV